MTKIWANQTMRLQRNYNGITYNAWLKHDSVRIERRQSLGDCQLLQEREFNFDELLIDIDFEKQVLEQWKKI